MDQERRREARALIARATALLPFVGPERRRRFRRVLRRLLGEVHGTGFGATFDARVTTGGGGERSRMGASFDASVRRAGDGRGSADA